MNALWSYLWPVFAVALAVGAGAGLVGLRLPGAAKERRDAVLGAWRRRRTRVLVVGALAALGFAALWHGPLSAADRFSSAVERNVRETLDYFEMSGVRGGLERGPLTRQIRLSGPADDFQRGELVRIIGNLPGVSSARWRATGLGVPLLAEGGVVAILGFLLGLLLAYLVELRRRYNAQWSW